jgi:hypothetical protein
MDPLRESLDKVRQKYLEIESFLDSESEVILCNLNFSLDQLETAVSEEEKKIWNEQIRLSKTLALQLALKVVINLAKASQ